MAETYIPPAPRPLADNPEPAPPPLAPGVPADPVRVDQDQRFAPAGTPVENASQAVFGQNASRPGEHVSVGNRDVAMAASFAPVSNENGPGTIYGDGPRIPRVNMFPPPPPVQTNTEVRFVPAPQPIENNQVAAIPPPHLPAQHLPQPVRAIPQESAPAASAPREPVRNETAQFTPGSAPSYKPDTYVPPPAFASAEQPVQKSDVINVGGDVQILPGSPPVTADTDRSFGGGGDPTKMARADEVWFGGRSPVNVGNDDVYQTPSGDPTRWAGTEDKTMVPSGDAINVGNHETQAGAKGEPTANFDHFDPAFGGKGKPKLNRS